MAFLTEEIRGIYRDGIDSLINELGKQCKVVFEPTLTPCTNCFLDTTTNRSSGDYNGTGPTPFARGKCPVCGGKGYLPAAAENFAVIKVLVNPTPKVYQMIQSGIQVPQGLMSVKGYTSDLPKLLQAQYVVVDYLHAVDQSQRYVKWGEPLQVGSIWPNRYFEAYLKRFGS